MTRLGLWQLPLAAEAIARGDMVLTLMPADALDCEFAIAGERFWLLPHSDGQDRWLVKPSWHGELAVVRREAIAAEAPTVRCLASLERVYDITTLEQARAIESFHLYTDTYMTSR